MVFRLFMCCLALASLYQYTLELQSKESLIIGFLFLIIAALHRIEEKIDNLIEKERI